MPRGSTRRMDRPRGGWQGLAVGGGLGAGSGAGVGVAGSDWRSAVLGACRDGVGSWRAAGARTVGARAVAGRGNWRQTWPGLAVMLGWCCAVRCGAGDRAPDGAAVDQAV